MVEEMPETINRRRFGNFRISIIHPKMISDQYPAGFIIDSFKYSLQVNLRQIQSRDLDIVVWQHEGYNDQGVGLGNISLDESGALTKYFRISFAEI